MAKKPAPPKPPKLREKTPAQTKESDDLARRWSDRLVAGSKDYDAWAKEYRVKRLVEYYLGKHWPGSTDDAKHELYTINLIFATVETQLPSLMFSRPKVTAEARPQAQDTPGSDTSGRATLIEQTLQTFVDDPKLHFKFETTLALRDAYWRFALVEVGYTADWIDNPQAGKPLLKEDSEEKILDGDGNEIIQPGKLPKKESLYVRRVPPQAFRVMPGRNQLESNDWAAYYEWHYVEDVKTNPDYENTDDLKATGQLKHQADSEPEPEREKHAGQVKIWKIWDFRRKVRHVLAEGHKKLLQTDKPYTVFPIAALKFYEIGDSWYPLPPLFNWTSPQDEINEGREMQRLHRRRAKRRYMREPSVKEAEFEKLEDGPDMVCIEVPHVNPPPIAPIADAPLDAQNWTELAASHDDFQQITGVSGEARGVPDSPTATQANIINVRAQLRESSARVVVSDWLATIVRLMLMTIRDKMQLEFMVKRSLDPFALATPEGQAGAAPSVARTATEWTQIKAEDVDELDVDVAIDLASLSPVAEDAQRQNWNVILQLLTNQPLLMVLMTPSPAAPNEPSPLLRKTLVLNGIKSDQEIREIWRVGQAVLAQMMMMQAMAAATKAGGNLMPPGGASVPGQPGQTTGTPTAGAIGA